MRVYREPLYDKAQTGRLMYSLSTDYADDLDDVILKNGNTACQLSDLDLKEFYDFVRGIPYRRDTKPIEVVSRPRYILENVNKGMDCKKKSLLFGSWFTKQGFSPLIDWRFMAVSMRPDKHFHHVFPQIKLNGKFQNTDATYKHYRIFSTPHYTAVNVLKP